MSDAEKIPVRIRVNGELLEAAVEPRTLLVEFLRENLNLTGTHIGCDTTYCGACTVILNGRTVKSCTMFAPMADGGEITTVEGLSKNGELHPIQEAFAECPEHQDARRQHDEGGRLLGCQLRDGKLADRIPDTKWKVHCVSLGRALVL